MESTSNNQNTILCSILSALALILISAALFKVSAQENEEPAIAADLEEQVARLRSRFHAEREHAVEALSAAGKTAVNLLEKAANSDYPHEQAAALRVLCRIEPQKAGEFLCKAVLSDCISLRLTAMTVAKDLGIAGARKLLEKAGKHTPEQRKALRPVLASACIKDVEKLLGKIASSPAAGGVFFGQYSEAAKLGSVIEPALSKIAADPSHSYAEEAAAALSELGDKAAIPALKKAFLSGGSKLRETAAAALHLLGEDGPYKEIVANYRKRCEDGDSGAYNSFSFFCCRAREYALGEKLIREYINKYGGSRIDHINLACFLSSQNKIKEALEEFVKGVEKGYTNMEWVKIDGELANLRKSKQFQDYVRNKFPEAFKETEKTEENGEDE